MRTFTTAVAPIEGLAPRFRHSLDPGPDKWPNHAAGVALRDQAASLEPEYPIAVLKAAKSQAGATQFVSFVLSPDGQALLKAAGFQGA